MRIRYAVVLALLGCGGSQFEPYQPAEIDQNSKAQAFALALETMRSRDLRILEQDESRGILSTQWKQFGGEHYNLQVLISPVSAVVNIGCRTEKAMTIGECSDVSAYPKSLVKEAKYMTQALQ